MKGIACVLLVFYHVIGTSSLSGLRLDDAHSLHALCGSLQPVRMPIFAMVAGLVFAMRPATLSTYLPFVRGKTRRLLLPGYVAITLFVLFSFVINNDMRVPPHRLWEAYLFEYAHFWFLQAIFMILLIAPLIQTIGPRAWPVVTILSLVLLIFGISINASFMSLYSAHYLLVFFALGASFQNFAPADRTGDGATSGPLFLGAVIIIIAALTGLETYSGLDFARRSMVSMTASLLFCTIFYYLTPSQRLLARIGSASFLIYLYHVFFTSASRRILQDTLDLPLLVCVIGGLVAGVIGPLAFAAIGRRFAIGAFLLDGRSAQKSKPA